MNIDYFREEGRLSKNLDSFRPKVIMGDDYTGDALNEAKISDQASEVGAVIGFNFSGF